CGLRLGDGLAVGLGVGFAEVGGGGCAAGLVLDAAVGGVGPVSWPLAPVCAMAMPAMVRMIASTAAAATMPLRPPSGRGRGSHGRRDAAGGGGGTWGASPNGRMTGGSCGGDPSCGAWYQVASAWRATGDGSRTGGISANGGATTGGATTGGGSDAA